MQCCFKCLCLSKFYPSSNLSVLASRAPNLTLATNKVEKSYNSSVASAILRKCEKATPQTEKPDPKQIML